MTTITIETDDAMIMRTEQGEAWIEATDTFLCMLQGCGYIFNRDKIMDAINVEHKKSYE